MAEILYKSLKENDELKEKMMIYLAEAEKYVRVRDFDSEELSKQIMMAKGPMRSIRQFAVEIGVNPSTLTRLVNMQTNMPSRTSLIANIAAYADPASGVTLETIMAAHGMELRKTEPTLDDYRASSKRMRQVILDELLVQGYQVSNVKVEPDNRMFDLVLNTNAIGGNGKWAFEFKTSRRQDAVGMGFTRRWLDKIMAMFYRGELDVARVSLVVEHRQIFEQVAMLLSKYEITDEISVILLVGDHISNEYVAPVKNGDAKAVFKG